MGKAKTTLKRTESETVDINFYFDIDDCLEFIRDCNNDEFEQICDEVDSMRDEPEIDIDPADNLYDIQKQELVAEALKKYSLEELERRLL